MAFRIGKRGKIVLISVGFVLLFLFGIVTYMALHFEKIVIAELSRVTEKNSNGLYHLSVGRVNIRLFLGKLEMRNILLYPDTIVLNNLRQNNEVPQNIYNSRIKAVRVSISNWKTITRNKNLTIEYLDLITPEITLIQDTSVHMKDTSVRIGSEVNKVLRQVFSTVELEEINIRNGSFRKYYTHRSDTTGFSMKQVNMKINNISLDSSFYLRSIAIPRWDNFECTVGSITQIFPGGNYKLGVKGVRFNYKDSILSWDSIALIPLHGKYEFAKKTPNRSDWTQVSTKYTAFSGIHIQKFLSDDILYVDQIIIQDLFFASFKNRKTPPLVPKEKPLFHSLLYKIPFGVDVSNITLQNGGASYEELGLKAQAPGNIKFTNLNASFSGVTNVPLEQNQYLTVEASGKFMDRGSMNALFKLPVNKENEHFEVIGTMGKMDLRSINVMSGPLAKVVIERGEADKMAFTISGTDNTASINYLFLYHDLKIGVLNEEGNKTGLASKVVNDYVLIPNNPEAHEGQRSVSVSVERDIYRSNFNYWWRAIFAGMKETVGFTEKRQEQLKTLQDFSEQIKKDRTERKSKREKKKRN